MKPVTVLLVSLHCFSGFEPLVHRLLGFFTLLLAAFSLFFCLPHRMRPDLLRYLVLRKASIQLFPSFHASPPLFHFCSSCALCLFKWRIWCIAPVSRGFPVTASQKHLSWVLHVVLQLVPSLLFYPLALRAQKPWTVRLWSCISQQPQMCFSALPSLEGSTMWVQGCGFASQRTWKSFEYSCAGTLSSVLKCRQFCSGFYTGKI